MDTISYHKARPLQSNIDLSEASLRHVTGGYASMKARLTAHDGGVMAKPEADALWFYVQQHAMGLVERNVDNDEPLGKYTEFVEQYHAKAQLKTLRMFYYLLLICTRESRHMKSGAGKTKVYNKYPNIVDFHNTYVQDQSHDAAVNAILENAPDVTLGEYTQFLVDAFTFPAYNSGYGGKAWKSVAKPLNQFVKGEISAEILMDTAFTLAHNNGPIFNKGMLFKNYSGSNLIKILDVQRSGQIPQLIAHHYSEFNQFINTEMQQYVENFSKLDSGFGGRVDWTQVKNVHGQACYAAEIAAQTAADKGLNIVEKFKAKVAEAKAKAAKLALLKGSYEIFPGVKVAKGKRSVK